MGKLIKGWVYRNRKMEDVDFFVTEVNDTKTTGYWLLRSSHNMIGKDPDTIDNTRINSEDWSVVQSG